MCSGMAPGNWRPAERGDFGGSVGHWKEGENSARLENTYIDHCPTKVCIPNS